MNHKGMSTKITTLITFIIFNVLTLSSTVDFTVMKVRNLFVSFFFHWTISFIFVSLSFVTKSSAVDGRLQAGFLRNPTKQRPASGELNS